MIKLIYYAASSLDGFIADKEGDISWLDMINLDQDDHGFNAFYESIDSLIMGRRTFEQIVDFGDWPYPGKPCWVLSNSGITSDYDRVNITSQNPDQLMKSLQQQGYTRTWLVGGGTLARSFHNHSLIDEYFVSLIPYLLGEGIPLLGHAGHACQLKLIESIQHASGVVQLRYGR